MVKADYKELDDLIDHLRSKGVVQFKGDYGDYNSDIGARKYADLTILPDAPVKPEKEPKKKEKDEEVSKKKGADGRTAEEQRELYGSVYDAEE